MLNEDLISVVMSAFNESEDWFCKSLESIINQTYKNIEIILIIDNPLNGNIIKKANYYKDIDSRIRLFINEENRGLVWCLNEGIRLSKGKFIARMDSDDISDPTRLQKQLSYMNSNDECVLVGSQMRLINEIDNEIEKKEKLPTEYNKIKRILKYSNVMCHPSFMFKKDFVKKIGAYREIAYAEDYDLITRIIMNGGIIENLPETLIRYRVRSNGICKSNINVQQQSERFVKKNFRKNNIDNNIINYKNTKPLTLISKLRRKKDRTIYRLLMYRY